jgi:phosphatidate phosphatase PAH1
MKPYENRGWFGKIVVFDIDGTIANNEHRRHFVESKPKNWTAFTAGIPHDTVYEDVKWLFLTIQQAGNTIVFCTGRGEESRSVTETWLLDNGFSWQGLYMRTNGDHRPDNVVKVELLEEIRRDFGEPFMWFDDRNQVVDAIRARGVRVMQVAPGNF